jgi:superfamily II DNA/RNA helicase
MDEKRPDVVIGAETGSGKTLSYLLPLMERLRSYPHALDGSIRKPMAVIMVPTQELVQQLEHVVRHVLAPALTLRPLVYSLTRTQKKIQHTMSRHTAPVLIGTPRAILQVLYIIFHLKCRLDGHKMKRNQSVIDVNPR